MEFKLKKSETQLSISEVSDQSTKYLLGDCKIFWLLLFFIFFKISFILIIEKGMCKLNIDKFVVSRQSKNSCKKK